MTNAIWAAVNVSYLLKVWMKCATASGQQSLLGKKQLLHWFASYSFLINASCLTYNQSRAGSKMQHFVGCFGGQIINEMRFILPLRCDDVQVYISIINWKLVTRLDQIILLLNVKMFLFFLSNKIFFFPLPCEFICSISCATIICFPKKSRLQCPCKFWFLWHLRKTPQQTFKRKSQQVCDRSTLHLKRCHHHLLKRLRSF